MACEESDFIATLNQVLCQAAAEMGARSVSAVLADKDQSIRCLYHWPDSAARAPAEFPGLGTWAEWSSDWIPAESVAGSFPGESGGFLLVRWPEPCWKVVLAFGFRSPERRTRISSQLSTTLRLAALAVWQAHELLRTRRDLHVVNERLGHRKTVERAKGLLQARHGWSEQQAYEHLRQLSRQRRKPMADTARDLLRISRGT